MASYNRVILLGNLTRDPELKRTPSGLSVCDLRVAVSETLRNRTTNEKTERTCYVDVTVWDRQAELCRQYLAKGSPLFVEGRLVYDEWKTPSGENRSRLRVQADRIQFTGAPRPQGTAPAAPAAQAPAARPAPASPPPPPPAAPAADDEEDLPF